MDKNKQMREALEAYESAREQLFMHCLSNGVFNAWGHAMDCTQLNDAHLLASDALRAHPAPLPQVDELAQFIRQIDGDHRMGAGALAEHICEWLAAAKTKEPT